MSESQRALLPEFKRCWKKQFFTGICYQALAFVLLTPLITVLIRLFVALSGKTMLADQDILLFLLTPMGLVCLVSVGGVWLGLVALQLAAMMAVTADRTPQSHLSFDAIRFAAQKSVPTIQLAARISFWTAIFAAPFLAGIAVTYFTLLNEFDINFYLTEKPPEFFLALGVAAIILIAMTGVLIRLFAGWAISLPLVLFENIRPRQALRLSQTRTYGFRKKILLYFISWLLATSMLSAATTSALVWAGHFAIVQTKHSLELLALTIGVALIVWTATNLAISLLSTSSLATLGFELYRSMGASRDFQSQPFNSAISPPQKPGFHFTPLRILGLCLSSVTVATLIGFFVINNIPLEDKVEVVGHRGSSASAPENTLASVRQAISDGADWVEIDVQETADGEVVVFHDSDFMKTAGVNLKIWNATLEDLKNIDIGSSFAPEFKQERVPTLDQVLAECKGKIGLYIELKYYNHDIQLEKKVVELIEQHGMAQDIIIISLKVAAIEKIKDIRPDWKTGLLMSVSAGDMKNLNADLLAVNAAFVSRSFIRSAHSAGKQVSVWTVNDPIGISNMTSRGVDSIITDKPALAREVLKQRAELNAPQRLILELAWGLGLTPEFGDQ